MNQRRERVIKIKEFLGYCVKRYYVIVLCLFIGAIGLAGLCYLKNRGTSTQTSPIVDNSTKYEDLYNSFDVDERADVDYAIYSYERLYALQDYIDNSIYMQIDPYAVEQTTLIYNINLVGYEELDTEERRELVNQLVYSYYRYVVSGGLASDMEKSGDLPEDLDSSKIYELIFAGYDGEIEYSGNFHVGTYATAEIPEFIDCMQNCIIKQSKELNKDVKHNVFVVDELTATLKNDNIYNAQRNYYTERNSNEDRAEYAASQLTGDMLRYYNYVIAEKEGETLVDDSVSVPQEQSSIKRKLVKYGIVGAVLGVIGACGLMLFVYMFSSCIVSYTDFTHTMGIKYLTSLNDNVDEKIKFAVVKIKSICTKNNINSLAVVSSNLNLSDDVNKKLKAMLSKQGMDIEILDSITTDCDNMDKLFKIGNCVFVEKTGKSKYNEVYNMVNLCEDNDINIIGVVDIN